MLTNSQNEKDIKQMMRLSSELKNHIQEKMWYEVRSRAYFSDDSVRNNHIVVEWGGLVYDINYNAELGISGNAWDYEIDWVLIKDVECSVSAKHGEDDEEICSKLADLVCESFDFLEMENW